MIMLALTLAFADEAPVDSHVVGPGDTLYGIAERNGLDWKRLAEINNETSGSLKVGDVLDLDPRAPHDFTAWEVQKGQTLWHIAEITGVSVETLKWVNDLERPEDLRYGTTITVREEGC